MIVAMDIGASQREIDAILKTLDEAKRYSGLGADDPAVIALESIMLTKVAELEAAKTAAAQELAADAALTTSALIADDLPTPSQLPKQTT